MNNYKVTVALNPDNTLSKEEADTFADYINVRIASFKEARSVVVIA